MSSIVVALFFRLKQKDVVHLVVSSRVFSMKTHCGHSCGGTSVSGYASRSINPKER